MSKSITFHFNFPFSRIFWHEFIIAKFNFADRQNFSSKQKAKSQARPCVQKSLVFLPRQFSRKNWATYFDILYFRRKKFQGAFINGAARKRWPSSIWCEQWRTCLRSTRRISSLWKSLHRGPRGLTTPQWTRRGWPTLAFDIIPHLRSESKMSLQSGSRKNWDHKKTSALTKISSEFAYECGDLNCLCLIFVLYRDEFKYIFADEYFWHIFLSACFQILNSENFGPIWPQAWLLFVLIFYGLVNTFRYSD